MLRVGFSSPQRTYAPSVSGVGPSEMWSISPALCPAQGCPKRCAGWTCPLDLPRACLTLMGSVIAELSPTPASLTDRTQNSYSFPVLSPGTVNLEEKCASFQGAFSQCLLNKKPWRSGSNFPLLAKGLWQVAYASVSSSV